MRRLLCLVPALLALLAGCTRDEHQVALCREALALLAGPSEIQATDTDRPGLVVLSYAAPGDSERHRLSCRFAGALLEEGASDLLVVAQDDASLPEPSLVMLRHLLGLPPPAALLRPVPNPITPEGHAAYLVQLLANGLAIGAILALVATGYSLVYGLTGAIQFAYGELYMIGAFLFVIPYALCVALGLDAAIGPVLLLAIPLVALLTAHYGWLMARLVYRPLRGASRLNALIAAIGLAIALREFVRLAQGGRARWLPELLPGRLVLIAGGDFEVYLAETQLLVLALAVILAASLFWLLMRTSWGRAHRACADDPQMAALLGVDLDAMVGRSFALAAALAALAGGAVALRYGQAEPYMGYIMGLKALTAALLGGVGTVTGAFFGGLLIGLFEALWAGYFPATYTDTAVFTILVLVLIFRPDGLFGRAAA